MRFYCESCHAKYSIDDESIRGRVVSFTCKSCGHKFDVRIPATPTSMRVKTPSSFDISLAPFDNRPRSGRHLHLRATPTPNSLSDEKGEWFYAIQGVTSGPFSFHDIKKQFESGALGDDVYVWHDSFKDWTPARELEIFSAILYSDETRVGAVIRRPVRSTNNEIASNAPTAARFEKEEAILAPRAEKIDEMRRKLMSDEEVESPFLNKKPIKPDATTRPETSSLSGSRQKPVLDQKETKTTKPNDLRATKIAAPSLHSAAEAAAKRLSAETAALKKEAEPVEPFPRDASLPDFSLNPADYSNSSALSETSDDSGFGFSSPQKAELSDSEFAPVPSDALSSASTFVAGGAAHSPVGPPTHAHLNDKAVVPPVAENRVVEQPNVAPSPAGPFAAASSLPPQQQPVRSTISPKRHPGDVKRVGPTENTPEQRRRRESVLNIQSRQDDLELSDSNEPVYYDVPSRKTSESGNKKVLFVAIILIIGAVVGYLVIRRPVQSSPLVEHVAENQEAATVADKKEEAPSAPEKTEEPVADLERPRPEAPTDSNNAPTTSDTPSDGSSSEGADSSDNAQNWQPTPPRGGVAPVKLPPVQPLKTLTREQALEGIKKVSNSVNLCRERYLRRGGNFSTNEIYVDITVEGSGDVSQLAVEPSSLDGTEFTRCMQSQRPTWKFVDFGGPPQKVRRKFIIQ